MLQTVLGKNEDVIWRKYKGQNMMYLYYINGYWAAFEKSVTY